MTSLNQNDSDNVTTGSPEGTKHLDPIRYVSLVAMGTVVCVGLLCNVLSLAVFLLSPTLRKTTTGHFLSALAIADLIFLIGDLMRWLHLADSKGQYFPQVAFMNQSDFLCPFVYFLRYVGKLASAWITVVITLERLLSVRMPLQVSRLSTVTTAKVVIVTIYVTSAAAMSFPFWTVGLLPSEQMNRCQMTNKKAYDIMNWIFLRVGSLLLPGALMVILTALLVFYLLRAHSERTRRLSVRRQEAPGSLPLEKQLSYMLLAVATAFVLLRLPYTIAFYINAYKEETWDNLSKALSTQIYSAYRICDVIATSNYAINFFLYCLCGSAFRQELRRLGRCLLCRKPKIQKRGPNLSTKTSRFSISLRQVDKHKQEVNML